jgi:hypothetical protein
MGNLKRFTTQYKGAEDRILLTGEDKEGETVSLWLTQRLMLKTVPVLVDWLQKNNPVDLTKNENSAQAQEMAQVFTRKPVRPKASSAPVQANNPADPEPVETTQDPVLVHSIDLNLNQNLLRIRLRQGEQELANLALNGNQLRQWLAVVHVLWKNAGWPAHIWPRWLSEDTRLVANQTEGAFH